ncbi:MAG: MarR family transcriptional regulator [Actinomycetota bacterium]|nr:MAG: MarR family transcriptional regulator [Actinomycetota bacterium]
MDTAATPAAGTGTDSIDLNQLGNDLRIVVGRIVRRFRLGDLGGEVTASDLSVLARLERHGALPPTALAEQERISPQAISAIVGKLEDRGLIARGMDAEDGRRSTLWATPAGRRLLAGRRSRNAQHVARALGAELSPEEQQQLLAALPLLERLADRL